MYVYFTDKKGQKVLHKTQNKTQVKKNNKTLNNKQKALLKTSVFFLKAFTESSRQKEAGKLFQGGQQPSRRNLHKFCIDCMVP